VIGGACEGAIRLAQDMWGLGPPEDCRIYVMTSWPGFVFRSAPWPWRILLGVTIPLWVFRVRRTWSYCAAWTQRFGRRITIGVKSPRLLARSDMRIGMRMFVEEEDMNVKLRHVTCHELVHACSAHLRLPMWLNEGIATVTVDRFLGKQTIRQETLALMRTFVPKIASPTYQKLSRMCLEVIAYQGIRGYWLVHYLEEEHPGLLRRIFAQGLKAKSIEREVVTALGMEPKSFWREIDHVVADHFEGKGERNP